MTKNTTLKIVALCTVILGLLFIGSKLYKVDTINADVNYDLIDMYGNSVDADSNLGKKQIMFFGYTFCPDVCPTTLQTITSAFDKIENPDEWVGVLITIDPKRDTAEVLREYISENFHKNITAYTGTDAGIKNVADAFQAKYNVIKDTVDDDFYLMEHSAFVYYINRDGSLSSISLYDIPLQKMLHKMTRVQ